MISLQLLGNLELLNHDGNPVQSVLSQNKRVALLAYLATGGGGGRARDQLVGLLFPDQEHDSARHALNQALYYLRRSLGKKAIVTEGSMVLLSHEHITSDTQAFRASIRSGDLDGAVALYRGALLDGFSLPGQDDFERWIDAEREGYLLEVLRALDALVIRELKAGRSDRAVNWAERAHRMVPLREAPLRRLLQNLVEAGEPIRAIQTADRFVVALKRELDMDPSEETSRIILDLRSRQNDHRDHPVDPPPVPVTSPRPDEADAASSPLDLALTTAFKPSRATNRSQSRWARPAAARWIASLLLLLGLAAGLVPWGRADPVLAPPPGGQARIAVLPFTYAGDAGRAYVGQGLTELMGITLNSLEGVTTVDPRVLSIRTASLDPNRLGPVEAESLAREYMADHYLLGSVVESGGRIQASVSLHRIGGGVVETVTERAGEELDLFQLADMLIRRLVAGDAFPIGTTLVRSAALTTGSLPALRHFLEGENLFRNGHFTQAVEAFQLATAVDSSFALAYYRAAVTAVWNEPGNFDLARSSLSQAIRHQARVTDSDRLLFAALEAFLLGRLRDAEVRLQEILAARPEHLEAWFQLGEALFHYGALHGESVTASEEAWEEVVVASPNHRAALIHLAAIAARKAHPAALQRRAQALGALEERGTAVPQIHALWVFGFGTREQQEVFLEELSHQPWGTIRSTAAYVSRFLRSPNDASRLVALLTNPARPGLEQVDGHLSLAYLYAGVGRWEESSDALRLAFQLDPQESVIRGRGLYIMPSIPISLTQRAAQVGAPGCFELRPKLPLLADWHGADPEAILSEPDDVLAYLRMIPWVRVPGHDALTMRVADRLLGNVSPDGLPSGFSQALGHGLLAERALAFGATEEAMRELELGLGQVEHWLEHVRASPTRTLARERFLLAELLAATGRFQEAEGWYDSIGENSLGESPYILPATIRIAEVREQLGAQQQANDAYVTALAMLDDADAVLSPVREELQYRITTALSERREAVGACTAS